LFWFHPLVWWLGARMMEERERACDEDVLDLGSARHAYAESILKVCEFCMGSPLASVSGVAGGDLKKRMANIMTDRKLRKLDFTRKLFLSAAGVGVVALPIAFGALSAVPRLAQAETNSTASAQVEESGQVRVPPEEMKKFVLKKVPPSYPELAKKAGIQGKVVLNATISKEGDISNLQIVSGHPQLVEAAIEAVKQWKYRPYLQDGEPVEVTTEITVYFTLGKLTLKNPD
jgi:TonB family protein